MAVPQRLETNRLVLRRHRRSDAPAVAALLDDWDVVKWLAQVPFPYREKDALDWVAQTNRHWADGSDYQFVLELKTTGTLVGHMGLRIENKHTGTILGYSCDTEPCPGVYGIARDVDILIHEAAGPPPGHSTARMAGEIASEVQARSLYLIHYHVWNKDPSLLVPQASETYDGPIHLCKDLDEFEF